MTKKAELIKNPGCAPAIWKKLNHVQKLMFSCMYTELIASKHYIYATGVKVNDAQHQINMHNIALSILWLLPTMANTLFLKKP